MFYNIFNFCPAINTLFSFCQCYNNCLDKVLSFSEHNLWNDDPANKDSFYVIFNNPVHLTITMISRKLNKTEIISTCTLLYKVLSGQREDSNILVLSLVPRPSISWLLINKSTRLLGNQRIQPRYLLIPSSLPILLKSQSFLVITLPLAVNQNITLEGWKIWYNSINSNNEAKKNKLLNETIFRIYQWVFNLKKKSGRK